MTERYTFDGQRPAPLPSRFVDEAGDVFFGLDDRDDEQLAVWGFLPEPEAPAIDAATQRLDWRDGRWIVVDLPPSPPEPEPKPQHLVIGKGEFLDLFLGAGVALSQIRAASEDPQLGDFWWALNNFYSQIQRDHPSVVQGVAAMVALSHITQAQSDAALAAWPVA